MRKTPATPSSGSTTKKKNTKSVERALLGKKRFDQLLDDAIFGVPKTKTGK